ncbi:hypothetical protein WJX72_008073 [[Myrmecia] bisecta]|uniref:Uncharacterized protein n=1 Tax=[Myrmecia] bisecta TaxID=41462 RepID=A0AAW1QRE0_9CHLO
MFLFVCGTQPSVKDHHQPVNCPVCHQGQAHLVSVDQRCCFCFVPCPGKVSHGQPHYECRRCGAQFPAMKQ